MDNNEDGNVDPWEITNGAAGYNGVSRHIVYAGGCDASMRPKDTRTEAQKEALKSMCSIFTLSIPMYRLSATTSWRRKPVPRSTFRSGWQR